MHLVTRIPLFPLGVVLLPEGLLPLHIFEERYKQMIRECLDEDRTFGVIYYDGTEMKSMGCTARVIRVLKRYPDGRMDILTQGECRFEVEELYENKPYLEAAVGFFDDKEEEHTEEMEVLAREGIDLLMQVADVAETGSDHGLGERIDVKVASYLIAESDGFTLSEKQEFLEMTSTRNRLEKGVRSLRKILKRVKLTKEIKKIITGNGHLSEVAKRLE